MAEDSDRRVTLKDIAKQAGVHYTTVSLALRGHPRIPAKTRDRICKLANKMGYQPDPILSALSAYRTRHLPKRSVHNLAFVVDAYSETRWKERGPWLAMFEGARSKAEAMSFSLDPFFVGEGGLNSQGLERILEARGVTGILFAGLRNAKPKLKLDWKQFSVVQIDDSVRIPRFHTVTHHLNHASRKAVETVLKKGYRRLGLILAKDNEKRLDYHLLSGYLTSRTLHPKMADIPPLIDSLEGIEKGLASWMKEHQVEVVMSDYNYWLMEALTEKGFKIPEQVQFVSLDRQAAFEDMAGTNLNHRQVAERAVEMLVGHIQAFIRGVPERPGITMMDPDWVEGSTLVERTG